MGIALNVNAQNHWTTKNKLPTLACGKVKLYEFCSNSLFDDCKDSLFNLWKKNNFPDINIWEYKNKQPSGIDYLELSINENCYFFSIGYGNTEYNTVTNISKSIAPFPGRARSNPIGFAVGGFVYYGLGLNYSDFWEYNPTTNTWRKLDDFTPVITYGSGIGFSMNNKGYIAAGSDFFYEYNPSLNTWKKLDSIPVKGSVGFAFSVNNKAYVYLKNNTDNFWEYDPKEVRLQAITTTKLNCFVDSVNIQYQIVPYKKHVITAQLAPEGTGFANPITLTTFTDSTGIANKQIALPTGLNTNLVYEIRLISNFGDTSSTEKLVLNLFPRKLTISKVNNTQLTCNGSASNSYIWLLNGQSVGITNATNPNLTITQNGYYQVLFDSLGCKTISDSFNVNFVGLAETQKQILSSIYPNPNHGEFTLNFTQTNEPKTIEILDALGKLQATFITNNQTYQAHLNHLAKGIYFVKINTPNAQQMVKLLIE